MKLVSKLNTYNKVNLGFVLVILLVFFYSAIYSAEGGNHLIKSACIVKPCTSTGLSRAFSEIIRFNLDSALQYNKYSLSIFSFFVIQLLIRIFVMIISIKKIIKTNILIITDVVISVSLYFFTFRGLIFNL